MTRLGRSELALAALLLVVGGALRAWHLELGWFGVDQARDVQTALDVAAGRDFPTVGPTMRRVTSLGALYHYVWALPHLVSADPLAAYCFAAALGVATLVATWLFARRAWGPTPALVALAVLATSRVAVIDGRVAWAPAALPAAAIGVCWLLAGPPTAARVALLGALLGVAVQLHLAMVAWVVAAIVLVLARRPSPGALVAGVAGGIATGFPAAYAALANVGSDAGLASLPSRGPVPNALGRLGAAWSLEWHVPDAFWQWSDLAPPWPRATHAAAAVIATAVVIGLVRSVACARRDLPARTVVTVLACQLGMVVLLPGEAWYYYLDALLPVAALAAGQAVVSRDGAPVVGTVVAAMLIAAGLVLATWTARWLAAIERHGYVALAPAALALDGAGGRDAAVPGRLPTAGAKRDLAALLAEEPATFAARWSSLHGPAFDDATGDNGFWLTRASTNDAPTSPPRHAVVWYRDDPAAPHAASARFELSDVGPFRVARYRPAITYATCRGPDGAVDVPMRLLPAPRRYGDGTIARPRALPARVECEIAAGEGATRVVAAVTRGTVVLGDVAGGRGASGAASSLCVRRASAPTRITIDVTLPPSEASDLDLYEQPDPECDAGKIAP